MKGNLIKDSKGKNMIIAFEKVKSRQNRSETSKVKSIFEKSVSSAMDFFGLSNDRFVAEKEEKLFNQINSLEQMDDETSVCQSKIGNPGNEDNLTQAFIDMITTMYEKSEVFRKEVREEEDPEIKELFDKYIDRNRLTTKY